MIKINVVILLLLSGVLLGCSVEGKDDFGSYYQKQASLDVLKMPPDVTARGVDDYYVVPPGPMADVKTVSILPPGSRAFQSASTKQPTASTTTQVTETTAKPNATATGKS